MNENSLEMSCSINTNKALALVVAASDKAGMEGIDRDRINGIILRESRGTAYMLRQQRQDERTDAKIEEMKERRKILSFEQECHIRKELECELERLIATRNSLSTKVVLDMDSFYVSAALLSKDDSFNKLPVCVSGGTVILTSNYVARRYGVRSAMASWIGDKLVHELSNGNEKLIHLPADFDLYTELSNQVRNIISEYDPNYRACSLDEAYFELAPYIELRRSRGLSHKTASSILRKLPETHDEEAPALSSRPIDLNQIVFEIREKILEVTGLTCSAGIAPNFMLAKIASDRNKPNGQCFVRPSNEDVLKFIRDLTIRKIPGVGRVTEKILLAFNIKTVHDLYQERAIIQYLFKKATASFLLRASIGWDDESPDSIAEGECLGRKGISRERTFGKLDSVEEIKSHIEGIAVMLSADMTEEGINARTITLKVKLHTFDVLSRSKSLSKGSSIKQASDMIPILFELLNGLQNECTNGKLIIRLLGIRCSNLIVESEASGVQGKLEQFLKKRIDSKEIDCLQPTQESESLLDKLNQSEVRIAHDSKKDERRSSIPTTLSCPICSRSFQLSKNDELNSHLDSCLNSSTIRQTIEQESSEFYARKRKKISDFFR